MAFPIDGPRRTDHLQTGQAGKALEGTLRASPRSGWLSCHRPAEVAKRQGQPLILLRLGQAVHIIPGELPEQTAPEED